MKTHYVRNFVALILVLFWSGVCAAHNSLDDAAIFGIFDYANAADIEIASLAPSRGASTEVKELAKMVATDHQAVQQDIRALAQKLAIAAPAPDPASVKQHKDAMQSLKTKRGMEFDRAYLRHEVRFHQSVLNAIETKLLPAISNSEFKALVSKILPGFRHHLDATRALAMKRGIELGSE